MKATVKFDKYGNVKSIKGNIGQTRANRAATALRFGKIEPTTGYKLRRFIKRFFTEMSARAESAYIYHTVGTPAACEIKYIGLEGQRD